MSKIIQARSPYEAARAASTDPDGAGWYLVKVTPDGDSVAWDVYQFGEEWVLAAPSEGPTPPLWYRWQDLAPLAVMLDGGTVGVDV